MGDLARSLCIFLLCFFALCFGTRTEHDCHVAGGWYGGGGAVPVLVVVVGGRWVVSCHVVLVRVLMKTLRYGVLSS